MRRHMLPFVCKFSSLLFLRHQSFEALLVPWTHPSLREAGEGSLVVEVDVGVAATSLSASLSTTATTSSSLSPASSTLSSATTCTTSSSSLLDGWGVELLLDLEDLLLLPLTLTACSGGLGRGVVVVALEVLDNLAAKRLLVGLNGSWSGALSSAECCLLGGEVSKVLVKSLGVVNLLSGGGGSVGWGGLVPFASGGR